MTQQQTSVLFHNGRSMPIIGFGTAGDKLSIKNALNAALETGYRLIDTAYLYDTEPIVGETLKEWFDSGKLKREDIFITAKLPNAANRPEVVEEYLNICLKDLQTDYLDLYIVHPVGFLESKQAFPLDRDGNVMVDMKTDLVSVWKALEAQVDAGKLKSIGLSNFNSKQIKKIINSARIFPADLQIELNVYIQQKELVAFCNALDITVCAYAPLGSKRFKEIHENSSGADSPLSDPVIQKIAQKHNKTAAQILLRHCIQRGIAVIPSSSNPDRVRENFQVFDFELDDDDMYEIYLLDKGSRARIFCSKILKGFDKHPEYPFNEPYWST